VPVADYSQTQAELQTSPAIKIVENGPVFFCAASNFSQTT